MPLHSRKLLFSWNQLLKLSFWFQVLELLSCNCKQCDDDCLCSSHGLICTDACSCKHCKNSNEEADEDEYFDNCNENDSESDAEY